jgi:hypothetical protein
MGAVIPIHSHRTFTREQAEQILPIVHRITERAAAQFSDIREQLQWAPPEEPHHRRLHSQLDQLVRQWAIKISQLGCEPRGIWLVDFDSGDGWFSWRYGDEGLSFFHPPEIDPKGSHPRSTSRKLPT